jgi:molybdopterin converting factor small subunit
MATCARSHAGGRLVITVRLPATLRVGNADTLSFAEPLATIAELVDALDRRIPGFRDQLDDSVFNFAVNDEMLLQHARERRLSDGDVVEIVATISGGGDT